LIKLIKNIFYEPKKTKKKLANFILKTSQLSMGFWCKTFEKFFAKKQKREYAVLFNSGGSANLALLQALKNMGRLKEGDGIGFTALTWSTNVMPIIQMGFVPVPVDVNMFTLNNDLLSVKTAFRLSNFKCLFITNVLGFTGELEAITRYCQRHDILLLEDNCEALGTISDGRLTGNWGKASTFSFFVAHHLSTIEGGMVCTDDKELFDMLKIVRANGWARNLDDKKRDLLKSYYNVSDFYEKYTFYDLGFNLRPTEITGFLGYEQLKYLDKIVKKRADNFKYFYDIIKGNTDFIHYEVKATRISAFAIPVLFWDEDEYDKYKARFVAAGVEIRPMIAGNIQEQPFYKKYVKRIYPLPQTALIHNLGFYFGNHADYTAKEKKLIGDLLK